MVLTAEERKTKQDQCSARMGTLLLQGWAMLETTCPDCLVPIMRSRDKKEEICCVCHEEYKNKAETPVPTIKPAEKQQIAQKEDSDEEYQKMATEYEKTKGVKLPPRNKGSAGRGFARKPMGTIAEEEPEQIKQSRPSCDIRLATVQALDQQIGHLNQKLSQA